MRLFIIFEVSTRGMDNDEEPLWRQVHWFRQGTGNGVGQAQSKQWAASHAQPDHLYCTMEVFNSTNERRYGGSHVGSAYYWTTESTVMEATPSEFGWPFSHEADDSPQADEEGRPA